MMIILNTVPFKNSVGSYVYWFNCITFIHDRQDSKLVDELSGLICFALLYFARKHKTII